MKYLSTFIKSLLSMGSLGLIILIMAILILLASLTQGSEPFYTALDRMELLDRLEGDISIELNEMQKYEAFSTFAPEYFGGEDQEHAQAARNSDDAITRLLDELREDGQFASDNDYAEEIAAELATFNHQRATHRETFDQMLAAYKGGSMDEAHTLLEQLQDENEELSTSLRLLVQYAERGRQNALNEFPADANSAILISAGSMTFLLLITLVGYMRTAAATRPLRSLSNAITAIGGDQYHPELLKGLLKRRSPAGNLARSLDQLAQKQQTQNAGLKANIAHLRQELYESRRRRLKLYHENESGRENK